MKDLRALNAIAYAHAHRAEKGDQNKAYVEAKRRLPKDMEPHDYQEAVQKIAKLLRI